MIWIDYIVEQGIDKFRVKGDWDREVIGFDADGNPGCNQQPLYSPGEVYIVGEDGWLHKTDDLTSLFYKYENK